MIVNGVRPDWILNKEEKSTFCDEFYFFLNDSHNHICHRRFDTEACTIINVNSDIANHAESQMHLLIIRSLVCVTSASFLVRNTLEIFCALKYVLLYGTCVRASNWRISNSFRDVWYNIIVIEMLPNRHACSLGFESPLYNWTHLISLTLIINEKNQ